MTQGKEPCGFGYNVSDEQLEAFGKLTLLQRLQWVEEARLLTLMARTPETAKLKMNPSVRFVYRKMNYAKEGKGLNRKGKILKAAGTSGLFCFYINEVTLSRRTVENAFSTRFCRSQSPLSKAAEYLKKIVNVGA